jgi:hypothetical protein
MVAGAVVVGITSGRSANSETNPPAASSAGDARSLVSTPAPAR